VCVLRFRRSQSAATAKALPHIVRTALILSMGLPILLMSAWIATAAQSTAHRTATHHHAAARHALYRPSSLHDRAPAVYRARFVTTQGTFVVEVHRAWAPLGADRFYNLVKYGYYNGNSFFRVLPGFVVQFGMNPKPVLNHIWDHASIKDDPVTQTNLRGYVTFATAGPNTRTTQVFINLADNSRLDSQGFAPFGQVTEGMDVVGKFYSGYGEGAPQGNGPNQDLLTKLGKPYLDKNFPKLDSIKVATIVPPAHPAHSGTSREPAATHTATHH
ncbi:MAG: peptidylprolyl isomerase, partial [Terriglobia bacterium]